MNRRCTGLLLSALAAAGPAAGETTQATGKLDAVTVYRGQAMITRLVEMGGPAGLREMVVTDLPESVLPGSIFAESADGLEVRSVRYRVRPVSGGMVCPQVPSKEISGMLRLPQAKVPRYHGGAPGISDGVLKPTTSATQERGMMRRPSSSGISRL